MVFGYEHYYRNKYNMETEYIRTGQLIKRDGEYLGMDNESNRIWTKDLTKATLYSMDMTNTDMETFMELLQISTPLKINHK